MEHGEPGRQPGPRRRAVQPARGDNDGVPRDRAHASPWLRDLDDAHARDLGVGRMDARQLLARGEADELADA
jgi:hypothetical protein